MSDKPGKKHAKSAKVRKSVVTTVNEEIKDNDLDDKLHKDKKMTGGAKRKLIVIVAVLALVAFAGYYKYKGNPIASDISLKVLKKMETSSVDTSKKKKKKDKKGDSDEDDDDDEELKLLNVEMIEAEYGNLGWSATQGSLVHKRPPRECSVKRIHPQVVSPFFVISKKTKWNRRIYTCLMFNKLPCQPGIMDDFEARRWKLKSDSVLEKRAQSTFITTNSHTLTKLSQVVPDVFKSIYYTYEGSAYINTILGSSGLGGSLLEQFAARSSFASSFGCRYNSLKVQMPLYRYDVGPECARMERQMAKESEGKWVLMGADGEKIETRKSLGSDFCSINAKFSNTRDSTSLATLVVKNPLKLESKLFDVRSFMLVGSAMPMMVFFQRGYVRRVGGSMATSLNFFDASSNDITMQDLQDYLATSKITGSHYVDTFLQSSMKQIAIFAFHAARSNMKRRKGSYQLFSLDFVIDSAFHVYLEKTSGDPVLKPSLKMDVATMIADMHDLVQELHEFPVAFETMVKGDKYGSWELVFSELRETCDKIIYNPCHKFIDFNQKDLVKSNKKVGKVQATQKRLDNEKKRIVKKTEEKKKNECRENKIPYPGSKCDKYMEGLAQVKFDALFQEHEGSHNPNEFRLPKPGEVFPHEIV